MRRNRIRSSREHVLLPRELAPIHSKPGELREFHPKSLHKTFPICRPPVAVSPLTYEHFCDRKRWLEAHVPLTSANGTFETCQPALEMSVNRGRPEETGTPQNDVIDP